MTKNSNSKSISNTNFLSIHHLIIAIIKILQCLQHSTHAFSPVVANYQANYFKYPSFSINQFSKHNNDDDDSNDNLKNNGNDEDFSIRKAKAFNETLYGLEALTKTEFLKQLLEDNHGNNASNELDDDVSDGNDGKNYKDSAIVKRRKRGGKNKNSSRYRTVDNRDSLPFEVRMSSPDPYTTGNQAKLQDKLNENKNKNKVIGKKNKKGSKQNFRKTDLAESRGITADIYTEGDDGAFHKVLGKFQLDKSTNCGDILEVGEQNFEVVRARCQYKYAGGEQFVMVRKILEVKEVNRIAQEASLKRQFEQGDLKNVTIHPSEI